MAEENEKVDGAPDGQTENKTPNDDSQQATPPSPPKTKKGPEPPKTDPSPKPAKKVKVRSICEGFLGPLRLEKGDVTDDPEYVALLDDPDQTKVELVK